MSYKRSCPNNVTDLFQGISRALLNFGVIFVLVLVIILNIKSFFRNTHT